MLVHPEALDLTAGGMKPVQGLYQNLTATVGAIVV